MKTKIGSGLVKLGEKTMEKIIAGKYKVVKELGRGGMGVVYLTWDIQLQRYCAIKFLLSRVPEQVARFKSEAQAMAQMEHPNIIKVHEICIEHNFFVMDNLPQQKR